MATTTETLRLLFQADAKGAVKEIESVGTTAEKSFARARTSADKWAAGLQRGGAVAIGAGAVIGAGLYRAALAAGEAESAVAKLQNALNNNPNAASKSTKAFTELASALQKKTAADDESIISAQANLATFRLTNDQIKQATPLVVDYARRFGLDLPQAAITVGKAITLSSTALKRQGVIVDEAKYKTDKFGAVMDALRENAGGFAEQEGKTFAGQLAIMKNSLGEVAEGVGRGAVPAFQAMLGPVKALSDGFQKLNPQTQEAVGSIAGISAATLILGGGLGVGVGKVIEMRDSLKSLAEWSPKVAKGLGAVGAIGAAYAGLQILNAVVAPLVDNITGAEDAKRDMDRALANTVASDDATEALKNFNEQVKKAGGSGSSSFWDGMKSFLRMTKDNKTLGAMQGPPVKESEFRKVAEASTAAASMIIEAQEKAGGSTEKYRSILNKLLGEKNTSLNISRQQATDERLLADALEDGRGALDEQSLALERNAATARESMNAKLELANADYAQRGAVQSAQKSLMEFTQAVNENSAAGGKNTEKALAAMNAGYELEGQLYRVAAATAAESDKKNENASATDKATAANEAQYNALMALATDASPEAKRAIEAVIFTLGLIRPETNTTVNVDTSNAMQNLGRLGYTLDEIQRKKLLTFNGPLLPADEQRRRDVLAGNAGGGPVRGWSMVGEKGPELAYFGTGAQIIPNDRVGNYARGGSSTVTYNVNVNAGMGTNGAQVGAAVVDAIKQYERRNGKGWRN